jgi:hypothetical protein
MELLDRYRWAMLNPRTIHPEFKEDILKEATQRLVNEPEPVARERMQRWL